jgi:putative hydrolase of the HAD superfamily
MHGHYPSISLFPGTRKVIEKVRTRGVVALVSEGRSVTQRRKIEVLGVEPLFDAVLITEELTGSVKKASGIPYAMLRRDFPQATRFVMIGDDYEKDALPAKDHGFETVLVRRPEIRYVKPLPLDAAFPTLAAAVVSLRLLSDHSR